MILRPNNDARPDWDKDGNRITGSANDPWLYDPVDGLLEVICDCDMHTVWVSKDEIGWTLPVCHRCEQEALQGLVGADQGLSRRERDALRDLELEEWWDE